MRSLDQTSRTLFLLLLLILFLLCGVIVLGADRAGMIHPGLGGIRAYFKNQSSPIIPTATLSRRPALRSLAEKKGLLVGVAVAPAWLEDQEYVALLTREFNTVTPENAMKFEVLQPRPAEFDFSQGDAIVDFARQNGMKVRGHTLVWGNQLPAWVLEADYSREEWIEILRKHITSVVSHYRGENNAGTVVAWDVVNEAVGEQGELFDNFWLQKIGPEYIALAFEFAHQADPDALLFYNDNGGEGLNAKSQGIYNLVKGLVQAGVPIHGVGLQMHTAPVVAPDTPELIANMQRLGKLGLIVHITEMDVRTQYSTAPFEQKLQDQALVYRQVMEACLQSSNCQGFFTWGLTDRFSWIPGLTGKPDFPLLFDENYQPKPALDAILELLQSH